jgi:hypothetical protein
MNYPFDFILGSNLIFCLVVFRKNLKCLVRICKGLSFEGLINVFFWKLPRFDVLLGFLCIVFFIRFST